MLNDRVYAAIERQRQKELMEQIEMYRQMKMAREAGRVSLGFGQQVINWLGGVLIAWGERLQASVSAGWSESNIPQFER